MEFSPQARAIADRRTSANKTGRVPKILGTDDTFSEQFKAAFDPETEHEQILGRINLIDELDAAKKTIRALKAFPHDAEAQRILKDISANPIFRKKDCPLCPIWRHEREARLTLAARIRYVFPRVIDQLYLVTIIFDFAENLDQLEQSLEAAQKSMREAVAHMGRKHLGVMMLGAFEFDLMSHDQLVSDHKSKSLLAELGVVATEAGGWTLTGHFFVRVPHEEVLKDWFDDRYPSSTRRWFRVEFKQINKEQSLLEHLSRILSYGGKRPGPLFDPPTRHTKSGERRLANERMRKMSSAFYGSPGIPDLDDDAFDLDAAIVQWAKFVHRVGSKMIYYSVESAHAQKWLSESEMDYIRMTDDDMFGDGLHKVEVRRDHGFYPPYKTLPQIKGKVPALRSKPLTYDEEWISMTDFSGIDPEVEHPNYLAWLLKQ